MPPVKKRTDLTLTFLNTEYTNIYTYICECGQQVTYYDYEKPEKLVKCIDCQERKR